MVGLFFFPPTTRERAFVNTSNFVPLKTYCPWSPLGDALQSSIKTAYFIDIEKARCELQLE
jgi:hypothetical protein